jgi:hypothetical protein
MTLHVLIRRQHPCAEAPGTFRAWVVQEGVKGSILTRGRKTIDDTKAVVAKILERDAPGCSIEWEIEEPSV